jgi:biotin transport system substrate-specific component
LALTQSPKQACSSALCYLFCATIGLPVLCGHANALWILGARGGYLVAFPIAAYLTSYIAHRWNAIYGIIVGLMVVYGLGFVWLSAFFEAKVAFMQGVVFFIPADLLKGLIAIGIAKKWKERI